MQITWFGHSAFRLDFAGHSVRVHQRVTWTNTSKRPASEIVFNAHSHFKVKDVGFSAKMLEILRSKYNVRMLACEGGPTLFRSLLERGLIDELNLTVAPYMFGGAKAPTLTGLSKEFLPASVHCSLIGMRTIGDECFLTYRIKHQRKPD